MPTDAIPLPAEQRGAIPHFDQYLGIWAIREENALPLWQLAAKLNVTLHLNSSAATTAREVGSKVEYRLDRGVAVIGLAGSLMKHQSSLASSSSTVLARKKIRAALANDDVRGILLLIESPGGTAAGTKELADEVAAAAQHKPVWAYCEDLCASAAYWIGSQAQRVFANDTAIVGSIGTYSVVYDWSAAAAKDGLKVHVVRAGALKGAGTPGTEITAEQLAEWQGRVNDLNEFFLAGVARGRRMSLDAVRALADGRTYIGAAAQKAGLIDGVQTLDQVFSQFSSHFHRRRKPMDASQNLEQSALLPAAADLAAGQQSTAATPAQPSAPTPAPTRAATAAELKGACPGASAEFILSQLEAGATVAAAQSAFLALQAKELAELRQKLAQAEQQTSAAAAPPAPRKIGVDPTPPPKQLAADDAGDPIAAFQTAVREEMDRSRCSKAAATRKVAIENPELQQAYVAAFNARTRKAG